MNSLFSTPYINKEYKFPECVKKLHISQETFYPHFHFSCTLTLHDDSKKAFSMCYCKILVLNNALSEIQKDTPPSVNYNLKLSSASAEHIFQDVMACNINYKKVYCDPSI
jgi:hypothetical protein